MNAKDLRAAVLTEIDARMTFHAACRDRHRRGTQTYNRLNFVFYELADLYHTVATSEFKGDK